MGRRASENRVLPLKRDPDANQEKLLQAAQKLFAAQGPGGTQIAQITREAGTGISMFYRYFTDKNDLLRVLITQFLDALDRGVDEALAGVERKTPIEQLFTIRKVFEHVIGMLVSRPDLTVLVYRAGFDADETIESLIRDRVARIAMDIASHIARAEEAGLVVVKQKEVLGHAAVGLALQVANKLIQEGTPTLTEAVDSCTRFTLGGLLVFCPPQVFNQIFPAIQFMLQPDLNAAPPLNPVEV